MNKDYLVGYGADVPSKAMWSCVDSFNKLKQERILCGEIVHAGLMGRFNLPETYKEFVFKEYGKDNTLYGFLKKSLEEKEKREVSFLRAEVNNLTALSYKIEDLKKKYGDLNFVVYMADIE